MPLLGWVSWWWSRIEFPLLSSNCLTVFLVTEVLLLHFSSINHKKVAANTVATPNSPWAANPSSTPWNSENCYQSDGTFKPIFAQNLYFNNGAQPLPIDSSATPHRRSSFESRMGSNLLSHQQPTNACHCTPISFVKSEVQLPHFRWHARAWSWQRVIYLPV